jgi:hypothetical protein
MPGPVELTMSKTITPPPGRISRGRWVADIQPMPVAPPDAVSEPSEALANREDEDWVAEETHELEVAQRTALEESLSFVIGAHA